MRNNLALCGLVLLFGVGTGCDSSDAAPSNNAGTGGGGSSTGGSSSGGMPDIATGGGGAAGSGVTLPDLTSLLTPMCNTAAESVASCGDNACPELPSTASATCTINCCTTDQRCGTRSADTRIEQITTTCTPPAVVDDRCPSTSLLGMTFSGCCAGDGTCGALLGPLCVPSATPTACDGARKPDAGMKRDAGMKTDSGMKTDAGMKADTGM